MFLLNLLKQSTRTTFLSLALCFPFGVVAAAETTVIYKYIDENGVLHLSNKKPPEKKDDVLFLYSRSYKIETYTPSPILPPIPHLPSSKKLKKTDYDAIILNAAVRYGLHPALIHAVIKAESNYRPAVVSPKGATGLMQLMKGTAKRYGVKDRTDPSENIDGGTHYLSDLLKMFDQDMELALAAYNAGENAVKRYNNKIPPYKETQNYVKKVMNYYYKNLAATL
ncbi:lytic transglycosylase domain-containing protein [Candidatus Albibeggiatoa sp. nov. NOAA]|uniref:lytic transglycosylase domain-containing protein n=1 Tax=Candidatus Albibeggiatoa sp. nov. NOAA TaxID=3162724 RepID=UPI0033027B23|nr:lytic transglycosylase domain-containing protein [Thiotrichaceae bacterium]